MPRIRVGVIVPGIASSPRLVDFVLDTGAMRTCIHPIDAVTALGIDPAVLLNPPSTWPAPETAEGVGGQAAYYSHACSYVMLSTPQMRLELIPGIIWIARLTPGNGRTPSLLGWDVLSQFPIDIDHAAGYVRLKEPGEA